MATQDSRSVAAFKLALCKLLEGRDLDSVRVGELVKESGYSRASFYKSFYDKFELARRIVDDEVAFVYQESFNLAEAFDSSPEEGNALFFAVAERLYGHILDNRPLYDLIFGDRLMGDTVPHIINLIVGWFSDTAVVEADGGSHYFGYHDFFMRVNVGIMFYAASFWARNGYDLSPTELAELYTDGSFGFKTYFKGVEDGKMIVNYRHARHGADAAT